ncbi:PREDICTED: uncharacterized protein LOC108515560 isoform X1 [Rhinopithecus bieti]|uniref:uncharacterized protein LOC108515560 isoform X1 n=1 Tax=Rhinopithecus bieti TaxID=61621 RepID=UPI00083C5198|nr:PREDICTED: uncharacterized protein LOC108515560 isoform X1 [Rhinopithecus bieti]XP_017708046.1 PREDICTED: uncharacterized protein LOC108515560 isoform X1 [Rhinopithecus bieti]XP_017708047.1 PREDICTED: uncharacterized protein LOC108515560 isoform X1 [Rhinopithecus bieti]XP_017708048.1 PREDICTED: uncharacterized protein LOC108515560 isoform X1 [Rhinopithecus bieti]
MRPPLAPSLHLPTVTVSFTRRAARERKREASEIPEWIDRCYVIGAASSTPQEARSWGERGSPAAGATRTVSPPHRSLELDIQEEAASFVFWCHRRWPLTAFGLLTWGGWVLQHPPTLLPPCGRQSHIQHHGQLPGALISSSSRQHKPLWNLHWVYRTVPVHPAAQDLSSPRCDGSSASSGVNEIP